MELASCSEVVLSFIFGRLSFCLVLLSVTLEGYEFAHQVLVHIHHCRIVIKITTIILRTENRYQLLILSKEAETIFLNLVPSANQVKIVFLEEFLELLSTENVPATSFVVLPVSGIFVGVIPE